ncbi:cation-transporting P-type ATPase [Sphingopyxis chilensis]
MTDQKLALVERQPWHALDCAAIFDLLQTRPDGLTQTEADSRLLRFGPNRLPRTRPRSAWLRFLLQFHNLLIYVLLASALLAVMLGETIDAAVILGVVMLNALVGMIQEGRAERSLEAIRKLVDPKASVLRDGRRATVPADALVPGDIVLIEAGDRLSADMRLFKARGLFADEALLTGESMPVEKAVAPVPTDRPLAERVSMGFSGTHITAGQGMGVVTATGPATELGTVSALLGQVRTLKTPLIEQMDGFAKRLTIAILLFSGVTLAFALLVRNYPPVDAIMTVVGIAVAAVPEGLPAVLTVTLAIGVQRMAARNAIIRRLPAVETLGSVSVICTDKTGTLTRNEMMVAGIVTAAGECSVSGSGYDPHGLFEVGSRAIEPDGLLIAVVRAGLLCNDASLRRAGDNWVVDGDPMEGALVALAMKAGFDPDQTRKELPRSDEIPFDAAHRFMATLHHSHADGPFVLVKGAPEQLLAMCALERCGDGERAIERGEWLARVEALAARGQRVLAFATKAMPTDHDALSFADVEYGLVFLGLMGLIDPPRDEALAAVAACREAGIRVMMITGDHAVTAREIARQLRLADDPQVVTGQDLDALGDEALKVTVRSATVFARTTPEHKLRLVEALQTLGLTVAMTGDGVNDAPALKRADVGVAMGRKGTETAKEAAQMVLADDNFASIVDAVREGRTVYDNLRKVIAFTLPTNGGEAFTIIAALALGFALPVTPVQILWINMVTAVALDLTLAFEPSEAGTMRRPPRARNAPLLTPILLWRTIYVSVIFMVSAFGIFFWADARGHDLATARTLTVNVIVVLEIAYLFSIRFVHGTSLTWRGVLGTRAVIVGVALVVAGQLVFTYAPFMNRLFESRPVELHDGLVVIVIGVVALLIFETEKWLTTRSSRGIERPVR